MQISKTLRHAEILAIDTVQKTQHREILVSQFSDDSGILATQPLKEAFGADSFVDAATENCRALWCTILYVECEEHGAVMLMNFPPRSDCKCTKAEHQTVGK